MTSIASEGVSVEGGDLPDEGHYYCPYEDCHYYGWLGLGNISSNGHPNGTCNRQLYCCVCQRYFAETKDTLFYGKRYRPQDIEQALTALTEGLGIRALGRGVEPLLLTVRRHTGTQY